MSWQLALGQLTNIAAQGVNPLTILGSSLLAWWTADRPDLITLNSTAVTSWKDVVAGYDAVQGVSASRPIYSATSFNGAPGLTFDSVDDELTLASQPFPSGASPSEIWAVVQQDALGSDASARRVVSYGGSTTNNDLRQLIRSQTGGTTSALQALVGTGAATTVALNTSVAFQGRNLARVKFEATQIRADLNGNAGTPSAAVPSTGSTRFRIGAATFGAGFWNGKMRDVLVTGPLSTGQKSALEAWALPRRML